MLSICNFLFSLLNSWAALPVILAPVAPRGWPNANAPPSMLTLLGFICKSFIFTVLISNINENNTDQHNNWASTRTGDFLNQFRGAEYTDLWANLIHCVAVKKWIKNL